MKYLERIRRVFAEAIGPEAAAAVNEDADIDSVPGWDSQSFIRLVMTMEDVFEIQLSTMDAAALFSIEAINAYLERRLA
jgi:acyl carrier protein